MLVDGAIIGTAKAAVEGVDFVVKRPSKNNTCAEKPRMEDRNRRQQLGTKNVARHRRIQGVTAMYALGQDRRYGMSTITAAPSNCGHR